MYNNIFDLIIDVKEFSRTLEKPEILPFDQPVKMIKGYIVYQFTSETGEEVSKEFECKLNDIKRSIDILEGDVKEIFKYLIDPENVEIFYKYLMNEIQIDYLDKFIIKINKLKSFL